MIITTFPIVLDACCLCSSLFHNQNGLFSSWDRLDDNVVDALTVSGAVDMELPFMISRATSM